MNLFRSQPVIAIAIMLAGCSSPTQSPSGAPKENPAVSATTESDDVLKNAIFQLRPENLGINAAPDKPVSLLNSWRFTQPEENDPEKATLNIPAGWMTADDETRANQDRYDLMDAVHIRDAMLDHTIAGYLSDRQRDEVKRASTVIDFVCRNIALWKDNEIEILLPPSLSLQFGRGSTDERAWLCAEILRQLRIDTFVLRSSKDLKETTENWLLGVIINNQIYLYDMKLGLPIPSDPANSAASVATLAELLTHPEWLEQLAGNEPAYRMTVDDLRDANVFVISGSNFWSRRMRKLEQSLPPSEICVLYDPLTDHDRRPGLLNRVAKAGNWPSDSLKLWGYPRRQFESMRSLTQEVNEELTRMSLTFSVPIPIKYDENRKPIIGNPEKKMERFRMDQLLGNFSDATKKYLSIRHLEVERFPPEIDRLNRMAAEDAFYWTCLCKYEAGEFEAAADQIQAYLNKYDRKGKWYYPARLLLARSYAELGQFTEAVATLQRTSADDPYRLGNAVLVKRWMEKTPK